MEIRASVWTLIIISIILSGAITPVIGDYNRERKENAVDYLLSHYDEELGLIYESEDEGTHWLKRAEHPEYRWRYNETYWLYSDNLIASHALRPFRPDIADEINQSISSYAVPPSEKFEALFGVPVHPNGVVSDIILDYSDDHVVLIRIHNGTNPDDFPNFVDSKIYEALSLYYAGNTLKARLTLSQLHQMWNSSCMTDAGINQTSMDDTGAETDIGYCANYKIALFLYACKVIESEFLDLKDMETYLWSQQLDNGGIATLSRHGRPLGSANAETTALTLLIYNDKLIESLQTSRVPEFKLTLVVACILFAVATVKITHIRRREHERNHKM